MEWILFTFGASCIYFGSQAAYVYAMNINRSLPDLIADPAIRERIIGPNGPTLRWQLFKMSLLSARYAVWPLYGLTFWAFHWLEAIASILVGWLIAILALPALTRIVLDTNINNLKLLPRTFLGYGIGIVCLAIYLTQRLYKP